MSDARIASMEGQLVAPPLRLAMRLVPGVGAVDLVSSDGSDVDADISFRREGDADRQ